MTHALLDIRGLAFSYGARWLIKDWSIGLRPGVTWFRGPNGAGKTTILRVIGGSLAPLGGTLSVAGVDLAHDPIGYRRRVFLCTANIPLLPWLKAQEFVDLHLSLYSQAVGDDVVRWFDLFQIDHLADQPISDLSLGQQRKLHLAVALALQVDVLLLDEPFNGLDVRSQTLLEGALANPARVARQCVLLSSHGGFNIPDVRELDLPSMAGYCGAPAFAVG